MRTRSIAVPIALAAAALGGWTIVVAATPRTAIAASASPTTSESIVDIAAGSKNLTILVKAVQAAGLVEILATTDNLTVFAPTDAAFMALGEDAIKDLLKPENKEKLVGILTYHVVPARVPASAALAARFAPTVNGQRLAVRVDDGRLMIDGAKVIKTDIEAKNGVIHLIDTVLIPSDRDVVATAKKAGHFKTLLKAAEVAGLVDALKSKGPLTLLAPTDEAFEKLPKGTLASLLKPENRGQLAAILQLHVIQGRVFSDEAVRAGSAATLNGESVRFSLSDGALMVNNTRIVQADVDASNGVVHVIDGVLLPSSAQSPMMTVSADLTPQALAELAIERGVPLFNRGDQDACAAVYEVASRALLTMKGLPEPAQQALRSSLKTAAGQTDATERAWSLRGGLDAVLQSMQMATN